MIQPNHFVKAGLFSPHRIKNHELEFLMLRRAFVNNQKKRPYIFPGEWVFPGGEYESTDNTLLDTALREFREESGYLGQIKSPRLIFKGTFSRSTKFYYAEFYSGEIDNSLKLSPNKFEIIDYSWFSPKKALELITSAEFSDSQDLEIKRLGLDKLESDFYRVDKREIPGFTLKILDYLALNQNLFLGVKNE
ncbi:NUDIX domain protein [uncultured archaeon]|nr:NUDIX domain protein [uncultured archaeon]